MFDVIKCKVPRAGIQLKSYGLMDHEFNIHVPASMHLLDVSLKNTDNTAQSRAVSIKELINILLKNNVDVESATDEQIETYFSEYLVKHKKLKTSSLYIHANHINGFLAWLSEHGFRQPHHRNIDFKHLINAGVEKKNVNQLTLSKGLLFRKYLTHDEFKALSSYSSGNDFKRTRDELALAFGYHTGVRASELIESSNFTVEALMSAREQAIKRFGERRGFEIEIVGKGPKNRVIYIPDELEILIFNYISKFKINAGPIFLNKTREAMKSEHYATNVFNDCKKALILDDNVDAKIKENFVRNFETRTFHGLRHTYATNLANVLRTQMLSTALLQERMGHSDPSTTDIYIDFEVDLFGSKEDQEQRRIERRLRQGDVLDTAELFDEDEFLEE